MVPVLPILLSPVAANDDKTPVTRPIPFRQFRTIDLPSAIGSSAAGTSQREWAVMKTNRYLSRRFGKATSAARFRLYCRLPIAAFLTVIATAIVAGPLAADIVTVSTNLATGTANRANANDFIGLLSSASPTQIGGADVSMPNAPAGQPYQVRDIVGRDIDATSGGRNWDYLLTLPGNAVPGTGFDNITFSGWIFEATNANLEAADQLSWQMFLNGSAVPVASSSVSDDFAPQAINLSNAGGSTINQILVRFSVAGFNEGDEWFMSRGLLSANYSAIPEPDHALIAALGTALLWPRRKSRS
jgi:hypothetical protein